MRAEVPMITLKRGAVWRHPRPCLLLWPSSSDGFLAGLGHGRRTTRASSSTGWQGPSASPWWSSALAEQRDC